MEMTDEMRKLLNDYIRSIRLAREAGITESELTDALTDELLEWRRQYGEDV